MLSLVSMLLTAASLSGAVECPDMMRRCDEPDRSPSAVTREDRPIDPPEDKSDKPGHGYGDKNHEHSGPPGHNKGKTNEH